MSDLSMQTGGLEVVSALSDDEAQCRVYKDDQPVGQMLEYQAVCFFVERTNFGSAAV